MKYIKSFDDFINERLVTESFNSKWLKGIEEGPMKEFLGKYIKGNIQMFSDDFELFGEDSDFDDRVADELEDLEIIEDIKDNLKKLNAKKVGEYTKRNDSTYVAYIYKLEYHGHTILFTDEAYDEEDMRWSSILTDSKTIWSIIDSVKNT